MASRIEQFITTGRAPMTPVAAALQRAEHQKLPGCHDGRTDPNQSNQRDKDHQWAHS